MSPKREKIQKRTYTIEMVHAGAPCPPEGEILRMTCDEGGSESTCEYLLSPLGTDAEPRGVSLLASACLPPPLALPERFIVKVPDVAPFSSLPTVDKEQSINEYLKQFIEQVKAEQEIVARLEGQPIARLLMGDSEYARHELELTIGGESRNVCVFLREWLDGEPLNERYGNRQVEVFQGIPLSGWFEITEKLIVMLHNVHLAGAPHGYICPTNIIVSGKPDAATASLSDLKFSLINFERDLPDPTLHMTEDERKDPTFCWRRRYDSPERVCFYHPKPSSPAPPDPFVPGDLYSLGLTLLYLAVGEPISPFQNEEQWRDLPWRVVKNPLRKSDAVVKEELRNKIFAAREGDDYECKVAAVEIVFACLRLTQHRFFNARAILEVYRQWTPRKEAPATSQSNAVMDALQLLNEAIADDEHINYSLLGSLYRTRLNRALLPFGEGDPTYRRYTVGTRPEIVDALVTLFTEMGLQGYTKCTALTTATFFYDENCSSGGRVLSSILRAVVRGCKIEWLFVLNESRMNHPNVIEVMGFQKYAWEHHLGPQPKGPHEIKFVPKGPAQYRKFLRENESFLYLQASDDLKVKPVLAVPDYSAEPGRIIALRVFPVCGNPDDPIYRKAANCRKVFDIEWRRAYPLKSYPHRFPA
jgi:hypothetical protein